MFGYVRPPLEALPQQEADRFRRAYCGLCHTLGRRYGPAARMILNYDFTYLAILLSDPAEAAPCRRRCVSSPIRPRDYQPATPALELAADESVILAWRRVLEQMLYHLGRWVYLIDAADDLEKDAASGNYNPVALRYGLTDGKWDEKSRQAFARTLDHSVHMIATAFELWDFGVWRPLLESTVYTALFAVGRAVLEGTFHRPPPREQRKKHKKETT